MIKKEQIYSVLRYVDISFLKSNNLSRLNGFVINGRHVGTNIGYQSIHLILASASQ